MQPAWVRHEASERPPTVDVKADVASAYLFRGQVMTDRPVLQPSVGVGLPARGGGTANLIAWGNLDLDDGTGESWFDGGHAGDPTHFLAQRELQTATGFCTQESQEMHFGLEAGAAYDLVVTFPNGAAVTVRDVEPGRTVTVEEPRGIASR